MFRKILTAMGISSALTSPSLADSSMNPYKDDTVNFLYHLLFCDNRELFQKHHTGDLEEPWVTIFKDKADYPALRKIAEDSDMESRVRMLAYSRLREEGQDVSAKIHLGTIIEVPMDGGLDTLAVFADGSARYINHSEKMAIVEGAPTQFQEEISRVIKASKVIVDIIDDMRLPGGGETRQTDNRYETYNRDHY